MNLMLRKQNFPEENELVLCTVTRVHFHSVFVNLDEYNKTAMIHISEISPGRIRNIRDFVVEGKKIVCKVLRVNEEKGHIDLSLRRVTEIQRRAKTDKLKQEQKAEKIIEIVAKNLKMNVKELYRDVFNHVAKKYDYLCDCFQDVVSGDITLEDLGIKKEKQKALEEVIKQRIKENKVEVKGDLSLRSYQPDGVELIKAALMKAKENRKEMNITYDGGGKYRISVESKNYKEAESIINSSVKDIIENLKNNEGEGSFARIE